MFRILIVLLILIQIDLKGNKTTTILMNFLTTLSKNKYSRNLYKNSHYLFSIGVLVYLYVVLYFTQGWLYFGQFLTELTGH